MKIYLLFALISACSLVGYSQFTRGVFHFEPNDINGGVMVEHDDGYYLVTLSNSFVSQKSKLNIFNMESNGDIVDKKSHQYLKLYQKARILGASLGNNNNLYVAHVREFLDSMVLKVSKFILNSNQYTEVYSETFTSAADFSDAREYNDDLVFFYVNNQEGLVHFRMNLNNQTVNRNVLNTTINPGGELLKKRLAWEKFNNNIVLYTSKNKTVSMILNGQVVMHTSVAQDLLGIANNSVIAKKGNQIVVMQSHRYAVLNSDLSLDHKGEFELGAQNYDLVCHKNKLFLAVKEVGNASVSKLIQIDLGFNIIEELIVNSMLHAPRIEVSADKLFLTGTLNIFVPMDFDHELNDVRGLVFSGGVGRTLHIASVFSELSEYQSSFDFQYPIQVNEMNIKVGAFHDVLSPSYYFTVAHPFYGTGYMRDKKMIQTNYTSRIGLIAFNGNDTLGNFRYAIRDARLPGPYSNLSAIDEVDLLKHSRHCYVSKEMIEEYLNHLQNPTANYKIPYSISHWPAHGDVSKGQAAKLAPFVDKNNNGIYEYELGDYPKFPGDACVFKIYNQPSGAVNSMAGDFLHYTFWFECDTSETLKNTIFTQFDYIPREFNVENLYAYTYEDETMGNPYDNRGQLYLDANTFVNFNGDGIDESTSNYPNTFGDSIPATYNQILLGAKCKSDGMDNPFGVSNGESVNGIGFGDGIPDNEYWGVVSSRSFNVFQDDPFIFNKERAVNSLLGRNEDGSAMIRNGVEVKHQHFGTSDEYFYSSGGVDHGNDWSDIDDWPIDHRISLMASGPSDVAVNDTFRIITAKSLAFDTVDQNHLNARDFAYRKAKKLQQQFLNNDIGCGKSFDFTADDLNVARNEGIEFSVFPNPTIDELSIQVVDFQHGLEGRLLDLNGREIRRFTLQDEKYSLSLEGLAKGVYIIELENNGHSNIQRVIKQ